MSLQLDTAHQYLFTTGCRPSIPIYLVHITGYRPSIPTYLYLYLFTTGYSPSKPIYYWVPPITVYLFTTGYSPSIPIYKWVGTAHKYLFTTAGTAPPLLSRKKAQNHMSNMNLKIKKWLPFGICEVFTSYQLYCMCKFKII